jgi:methionyl-tRNA formyltransferase
VLERLDEIRPVPQPAEGVTYAAKIAKDEARIDFRRTADEVERQIRAFNPAPGAFFELGGERIRVLAAEPAPARGEPGLVLDHGLAIACGEGSIIPSLVQRAGRGVMTSSELLRGFVIPAGTRLQ